MSSIKNFRLNFDKHIICFIEFIDTVHAKSEVEYLKIRFQHKPLSFVVYQVYWWKNAEFYGWKIGC